jgi:2-(1,2-epoxy-1,2-dihydrophenyl)acetyl-CoA isomerase
MTTEKVNILTTKQDGIMTVTLNRPEKLNAMRKVEFTRLAELIEDFRDSPEMKIFVLTGKGRAFCAGEDLNELLEPAGIGLEEVNESVRTLQAMTELLVGLDKPTIAAINGPAVGFGLEISAAFDIRIASTDAYFWFSEITRGLLPTNASFFLIPRLIGLGNTTKMMLAAEKIPADQALAMGLVSTVTSPEDLQRVTLSTAQMLMQNSETSTRLIKNLLRNAFELPMSEILEMEVQGTLELAAGGEFVAGAQAFLGGTA